MSDSGEVIMRSPIGRRRISKFELIKWAASRNWELILRERENHNIDNSFNIAIMKGNITLKANYSPMSGKIVVIKSTEGQDVMLVDTVIETAASPEKIQHYLEQIDTD